MKRLLKSVLFGAPGARDRRIRAGLLRGRRFAVDSAHKSMRLVGLDEREIAGWVRRLSARTPVAVDVGAHDGWYTAYFATRPHIRRVFAVEPSAASARQLLHNLRLNGPACEGKTTLVPLAAGDVDRPGMCRLDTLLRDVAEPVVIKIDVDGFELDVLRGAAGMLARLPCALIVETHSVQLERECLGWLDGAGYRSRIVPNGWYRLFVPERRVSEHNRWFVAEPASSGMDRGR